MKKIFASVCVIVMCATMISCGVDDRKVQKCIGLHLDYEQKIKDYERLDTLTMGEVRDDAYHKAEEARKTYLKAFAQLTDKERRAYHKLEAECKKADEDYLGSIYEDEDSADETKWHKLEATYTNVMK